MLSIADNLVALKYEINSLKIIRNKSYSWYQDDSLPRINDHSIKS